MHPKIKSHENLSNENFANEKKANYGMYVHVMSVSMENKHLVRNVFSSFHELLLNLPFLHHCKKLQVKFPFHFRAIINFYVHPSTWSCRFLLAYAPTAPIQYFCMLTLLQAAVNFNASC